MPKPNATVIGVIGFTHAVQVNTQPTSQNAPSAIVERVKHCVGQIHHSRKLGAATRLLRSQNELRSLVSKWGSVELDVMCSQAGIKSGDLF